MWRIVDVDAIRGDVFAQPFTRNCSGVGTIVPRAFWISPAVSHEPEWVFLFPTSRDHRRGADHLRSPAVAEGTPFVYQFAEEAS